MGGHACAQGDGNNTDATGPAAGPAGVGARRAAAHRTCLGTAGAPNLSCDSAYPCFHKHVEQEDAHGASLKYAIGRVEARADVRTNFEVPYK